LASVTASSSGVIKAACLRAGRSLRSLSG
jgi:hypothetical protein